MSRIASRLTPSPAMVVAVIALVVALAGGAYAAGKLRGSKIKPNTVTGKQVRESSLGPVPSADQLTGELVFNEDLAFGTSTELGSLGPFSFQATCTQNGTSNGGTPNQDIVNIIVRTSEANSVMTGQDNLDGGPAATDFLQPETNGGDSVFIESTEATGLPDLDDDDEASAAAPSGARIVVPNTSVVGAVNYNGQNCSIWGSIRQIG